MFISSTCRYRRCRFPVEIGLRLEAPCRLQEVVVVSEPGLAPSAVECFVAGPTRRDPKGGDGAGKMRSSGTSSGRSAHPFIESKKVRQLVPAGKSSLLYVALLCFALRCFALLCFAEVCRKGPLDRRLCMRSLSFPDGCVLEFDDTFVRLRPQGQGGPAPAIDRHCLGTVCTFASSSLYSKEALSAIFVPLARRTVRCTFPQRRPRRLLPVWGTFPRCS